MKRNRQNKSQNKSNTKWLIGAGIVLFGAIALFSFRETQPPVQPQSRQASQTPQTEAKLTTLPPSMFAGKAREAYQAAQDVPEVLSQVQCYCGCRRSDGHENNLFCFADMHGSG